MTGTSPAVEEYAGPRTSGRRLGWGVQAAALFVAGSLCLNLFLLLYVRQLRASVQSLRARAELQIGAAVSPIKAKDVDGRQVTITFDGVGRPTVLYIFSPTCGWCDENVDKIKALADRKRQEYQFLGISLSNEGLPEYVRRHDLNFPVFNGLSIEAMRAYRLGRTPQTAVISPDGRVLANWFGVYEDALQDEIERYFRIGRN